MVTSNACQPFQTVGLAAAKKMMVAAEPTSVMLRATARHLVMFHISGKSELCTCSHNQF